jgi:hypothetical protein
VLGGVKYLEVTCNFAVWRWRLMSGKFQIGLGSILVLIFIAAEDLKQCGRAHYSELTPRNSSYLRKLPLFIE